MSVITRLASVFGRRNGGPNQELARDLTEARAVDSVRELVVSLGNPDRNIQSDCVKVLYQIGTSLPNSSRNMWKSFWFLLESKNNRLVWGDDRAVNDSCVEPFHVRRRF